MAARRRSKGEGSARFRPERDKWEARIVVGYDVNNKMKRVTQLFDTKRQAESWLAEKRVEQNKGLLLEPNRVTLAEYAQRWLEVQLGIRQITRFGYGIEINYIVEKLGNERLQTISAPQVRAFIAWFALERKNEHNNKKMSTRTVGKVLTRLKAIFTEAQRDRIITYNPCDGIRIPSNKDQIETPADKVYTFVQAKRFLALGRMLFQAGKCRLWFALETCLKMGLRRSEVLGLIWTRVNMERQEVSIRSGLAMADEVVHGGTKTTAGSRNIPFGNSQKRVFEMQLEAQKKEKENASNWENTGAVFATATGDWVDPHNLNRAMRCVLDWSDPKRLTKTRLLGIATQYRQELEQLVLAGDALPNLSVHGLRHTYATHSLQDKVPLEVVSKNLGHSRSSVTIDIYRHVLADEQRQHLRDLYGD